MKETSLGWPYVSFLEGLHPTQEQKVEVALLASYSADIGSIGAALLALAGNDNDGGSGNAAEFADAVELLRGKVRIVIQRGRLAKSKKTPKIASILDQFVREVARDEAFGSWHPKVALIRYRNSDATLSWRLWLGSRNLTEGENLELGLLLVSHEQSGTAIDGVHQLAIAIAEQAGLPKIAPLRLADEVSKVKWKSPLGIKVNRIHWMDGLGNAQLTKPESGTNHLVIVSPFVDKTFLDSQRLENAENRCRVLVTTMQEIERLGPSLSGFNELRVLAAPEYPVSDAELDDDPEDATRPGEEEHVHFGLHAKLILAQNNTENRMWIGSANATSRAWAGRNVEVVAELAVSDDIARGMTTLMQISSLVELPKSVGIPDPTMLEKEKLEQARTQVAAKWAATLSIQADFLTLTHSDHNHPGPHPTESDIHLQVATLAGPLFTWSRGDKFINLGPAIKDELTEFVRLRVSRGDLGITWIQRAPAIPPFELERDRQALARFLGMRGFLLWLMALLDNHDGDEADWKKGEGSGSVKGEPNEAIHFPALEEILAAWTKDPKKFAEIDRRVKSFLPAILAQSDQTNVTLIDELKRFSKLWKMIQEGLG
ncbi:phospholipase D family protein [Janthinobacterium lividum]|uniref:phospholipase D family protein n=1 Tax=Janthinobacterium lividum TaxID=29581 RepID=UPI000873BCDD|nr:phospholipase D family protein [Janthinobacterium lividum]MCC7716914.1 phospholipase D family protein [Janthinobacterium lividum]OEZ62304.1 hypothetical protein JANLI_10080 [Janthinobacterium lividum]WQE31863.1 phospholipase D family protein [Janthinobacterium lividum]STS86126.1 Uncharacterised protein [Janthinobacterium lividum]